MVGIYFSGTGNSRYAVEFFCYEYDEVAKAFSIEDDNIVETVRNEEILVFAYPVQYSTVPKILRDFIIENKELWKNKKVFVIATMGLFSGDGAGILGRLLQQYGAEIIGGLHLKMPDSIGDEKVLKRPLEKNKKLVKKAGQKISKSVQLLKAGKPTREGLAYYIAWLASLDKDCILDIRQRTIPVSCVWMRISVLGVASVKSYVL